MSLSSYLILVSIPTVLGIVIALFIGTPSHHNTFHDPSATLEEHKMKIIERQHIPFSVPWVIVYIGMGLSLVLAVALPIINWL